MLWISKWRGLLPQSRYAIIYILVLLILSLGIDVENLVAGWIISKSTFFSFLLIFFLGQKWKWIPLQSVKYTKSIFGNIEYSIYHIQYILKVLLEHEWCENCRLLIVCRKISRLLKEVYLHGSEGFLPVKNFVVSLTKLEGTLKGITNA